MHTCHPKRAKILALSSLSSMSLSLFTYLVVGPQVPNACSLPRLGSTLVQIPSNAGLGGVVGAHMCMHMDC